MPARTSRAMTVIRTSQSSTTIGSPARDRYQKIVVWYDNPNIQQYEYALIDINGGSVGITGSGLIVFLTDTDEGRAALSAGRGHPCCSIESSVPCGY
jgi:L-lactate utilization protein LutC